MFLLDCQCSRSVDFHYIDVSISWQQRYEFWYKIVACYEEYIFTVSNGSHQQFIKALACHFYAPNLVYPYFFGFWMLLIILHGAVEGREMNEIAATVHQPVGEVSYRQSLLRCCLHVDIWVFHKERHCLVLRVEHKIVGADIS